MRSPIRVVSLVCLLSMTVSLCFAATSEKTESKLKRISFRTQKPTVAHLSTDKEVKETTSLLKEIGCDLKVTKHDGHVDVRYECRYWKSISLKTDTEAKKWDAWLTSKGFFVVHNTPSKDHKETVQYRLSDWRTMHFKTKQETEAYAAMFKMLGCEVEMEKHGDHEDIKVRCNTWGDLGVPNHSVASEWMRVLRKLGFEVSHHH